MLVFYCCFFVGVSIFNAINMPADDGRMFSSIYLTGTTTCAVNASQRHAVNQIYMCIHVYIYTTARDLYDLSISSYLARSVRLVLRRRSLYTCVTVLRLSLQTKRPVEHSRLNCRTAFAVLVCSRVRFVCETPFFSLFSLFSHARCNNRSA